MPQCPPEFSSCILLHPTPLGLENINTGTIILTQLTETTVLSFNLALVDIQNITLVGLKIRVLVILFHIGNAVETIQISS